MYVFFSTGEYNEMHGQDKRKRDQGSIKSGDVISIFSRENRELPKAEDTVNMDPPEGALTTSAEGPDSYFEEIVKQNQDKKKKMEEERTKNNRSVLHSYRIK